MLLISDSYLPHKIGVKNWTGDIAIGSRFSEVQNFCETICLSGGKFFFIYLILICIYEYSISEMNSVLVGSSTTTFFSDHSVMKLWVLAKK